MFRSCFWCAAARARAKTGRHDKGDTENTTWEQHKTKKAKTTHNPWKMPQFNDAAFAPFERFSSLITCFYESVFIRLRRWYSLARRGCLAQAPLFTTAMFPATTEPPCSHGRFSNFSSREKGARLRSIWTSEYSNSMI